MVRKLLTKIYDFIVLGGGTGGLNLALAAARHGKHTLLIESSKKLGGTCLNNGCIPTKAMLEAAHRYDSIKELKEFGMSLKQPKINIVKILKRVNGIVQEGQDHIRKGLVHSELDVVYGHGFFVDKKTIKVGEETYSAKKIVIATGAKNRVPFVKGLSKIIPLTNENILLLKSLPKSIVMIGAGYISMEFATFFNLLGVKVIMLEYSNNILAMIDHEVVESLEKHYLEEGVIIKKGVEVLEIIKKKNSYEVHYGDASHKSRKPKTIITDQLFVAIGRIPNTVGIGLENTKIKIGKRGEIITNDYLETNQKGVYAMGDVLGRAMFAHAVKEEVGIILHNILHNHKEKMNFSLIPWAVFTSPTVAGIGMSETQAIELNLHYDILFARFNRVGRAKIINDSKGFIKIVYEKKSRKLLGACIVGPQADNLIHEIVVLMNSKDSTITPILDSIHIHPTLSEIMSVLH